MEVTRLLKSLDVIAERGYEVECCLYNMDWFDGPIEADLERLAEFNREFGLITSLHNPLYELNIASLDAKIREVSMQRFERTQEIAQKVGARWIIFHTGFQPLIPTAYQLKWVEGFIEYFGSLAYSARDKGLLYLLENSWDHEPEYVEKILESFDEGVVDMCLDYAHVNIYSPYSLEDWSRRFTGRVRQLHLNNNYGDSDDHLPLDEGDIDYLEAFRLIEQYHPDSALVMEVDIELAERCFSFAEDCYRKLDGA